MAKEELVDAFETEEVSTGGQVETKEMDKKKPVKMLMEKDAREGKDGKSVYPKYQEYIEILGGWSEMSDADKKKINGSFKKPGKAFGGTVDVSKLSPVHRQALDLIKTISDAAYAGVGNNAMDSFNELQALNPDSKLSVEIYMKGKKPFIEGLPEEEK